MGGKKRKRRARQRHDIEPQSLYDHGDYERAISILLKRVKHAPSDADKRLLARSLLNSGDNRRLTDALRFSLSIENKELRDFWRIGWCYILQEDWNKAIAPLDESNRFGEFATTYYLRALALAAGKASSALKGETKEKVDDLLKKALALADCPEEAFIWSEKLIGKWSDEAVKERISILQNGLNQHPMSETIRYRLARLHIWPLKEFEKALDLLRPLLLSEPPMSQALWLAYEAHLGLKDDDAAINCLDLLISQKTIGVLQIVKGMVLLEQAKPNEAIACFENALAQDTLEQFHERAIVSFGIAEANVQKVQINDAVQELSRLVTLLKSTIASGDYYVALGSFFVEFWIDDEHEDYGGTEFIAKTCKRLLDTTTGVANDETKGWLWYILYLINRDLSDTGQGEGKEESLSCLRKASSLVNHPAISQSLADYYLWEAKDIPQAVEYHLKGVLWRYSANDPNKNFGEWEAEFCNYDENGECEPVEVQNQEDRLAIHELATDYLKGLDANQFANIVVPFYKSFWRHMLVEGRMFRELRETTGLILAIQEDESVLFDHAYGSQMLGIVAEAEDAYRKLLGLRPDDSSALHNLAILLKNKGESEKALQLSNKAVSLSQEDENATRLNKALRKEKEDASTRKLIESGLLVTRVIRARLNQVSKPVFNSPREKLMYDLLLQLFPNYLIFPNMACSAIFNYDEMKVLLGTGNNFRYFLMASTDFCVVSTTDYMPIVALEVDSKYHDTPEQSQKDELKDRIFELGGVPLIRLRPKAGQGANEMKLEIIRALKYARIGVE